MVWFIGALAVYIVAVPFGKLKARHMEEERHRQALEAATEQLRRQ